MSQRNLILLVAVLSVLTLSGCDALLQEKKGGGEVAYDMQQTQDGGFILAGARYLDEVRSVALLIKNDSRGDEEWSQAFDLNKSDMKAYSVQHTRDGGYILTGTITPYSHSNAFLIKTDSRGNEEWSRIYGGDVSDYAYSVSQAEDGGFILTGYTWSYGAGRYDAWLLKTDALGNEEWSQTYGGSENDKQAYFVQQTSDGGYILTGVTEAAGHYIPNPWLLKTDALGNEEWSQVLLGDLDRAYATAVQQTRDGGFIFILSGMPYFGGSSDLRLIKTDALGNEEWLQFFDGSVNDYARSVRQAEDGGYILAGGSVNPWLLKTDALGNEEWLQVFGGSANDYAHSVQQAQDGGFVLAGYTRPRDGSTPTAWLIKTGPLGNEEWAQQFGDEYVVGYAATAQLLMLLAVLALLLFNVIYFLVFFRDMKARGEKYPAWFIKYLLLGPLAAAWYITYRKPKDGEAVSENKFETLAKYFAIHWSIYAWLFPTLILVLVMLFQGTGYAIVTVLAALISGLVFIWLAVWLAPLSTLIFVMLIITAWRGLKGLK